MKTRSFSGEKLHHGRILLVGLWLCAASHAAPKPMIEYFKPIPLVGKLTTSGWGYTSVGPHDPSNGLENTAKWWYWDGKIIKAPNGKYHMFASRWDMTLGIGAWMSASISVHATSDSALGPYTDLGPTYTYQNSKGHNTTGVMLLDSTYAVIESAIVPGWIFTSKTLDGPFTYQGSVSWDGNGFNPQNVTSNMQIMIGPDNKYWTIGSSGFILNSDKILGTYKAVGPSCYITIPGQDLGKAEDPILWYSGGYFHVVYNFWNTRKGYHIMSKDGMHNWISTGVAVDRSSNFIRYTDGTVNHWGNMERPDVYMENGHVVAFTFAVTDKNKDSSNSATCGKILVVPFDGVKFDADSGGTVVTGIAGKSGGKGSGGIAGRKIGASIAAGTARKGTFDLSGKVIGKIAMPKSGIYMVQIADGRRIKKTLNFRTER